MIDKPPPFKGLNIRIPIIIPIGLFIWGLEYVLKVLGCKVRGSGSDFQGPGPKLCFFLGVWGVWDVLWSGLIILRLDFAVTTRYGKVGSHE